jgi:hypothetical protein
MARSFFGHFVRRELPEFFVDQRQQLIGGIGIALFDTLQDLRNVAHFPRVAERPDATTRNVSLRR